MVKSILIISQHFYPEIGSAGNRIKNIFELLKGKGYELKLLTIEPSYPNKNIYKSDDSFWDNEELNIEEKETNNIVRIRVRNRKYSLNMYNRLVYYLEVVFKIILYILTHSGKYNMVFVTSPPIFIAFAGIIAKYRYRTKMVLDIRDLWPESLKGVGVFNHKFIMVIFKKLEKLLYSLADKIIVNSNGFIDYIVNETGIDKHKVVYIPNGIRTHEITLEQKGYKPFRVIYAGNMGLAQDTSLLISLAERLKEYNIGISIIGYGVKRKNVVHETKKRALSNVTFINPKTRSQCFELIASHDAGVMTLSSQSVFKTVLPGKLIDYMACGVPVVAMASGFSKDLIEKGRVGYCFETYNVEDILNSILFLYENENVKRELGENGKGMIREHFLWEKNVTKLTEVIETL
jgi:glycosyltransferase involved in cell wall biosynthesis